MRAATSKPASRQERNDERCCLGVRASGCSSSPSSTRSGVSTTGAPGGPNAEPLSQV